MQEVKYPSPTYQLYAVNKATFAMTQIAEGPRSEMGREMNARRHSAGKDLRYSIYQGKNLISQSFN